MMGRHSVDYHAKTLGIGEPHRGGLDADPHRGGLDADVEAEVGAVLGYYSSHGETPLVWGGSGAEALGLVGAVLPAHYEAVFAEGGALDPTTGPAWCAPSVRAWRSSCRPRSP